MQLAFAGDELVGTLRILLSEPIVWPDIIEDDAVYVHSLAVRRGWADHRLGLRMLEWAGDRAASLGRKYIRLDCVADNQFLRDYYAKARFEQRGEIDARFPAPVGTLRLCRYEKRVGAPTVDRIAGCLKGIATGDAIGKQTETLSGEEVRRWYPQGIWGFEGSPDAIIPRYIGNSKRQWRIGETTDDTERTVAVARAIIAERGVSHTAIGREMLLCTKCVHPGIRSLWEFHQAADPARIATAHDGCGAAIRIAPVGILYKSDRLDELVNGAREASISTHGGCLAIAAAAATAAAVSAAIDGASAHQVLELAERAAARAESRWPGRSVPAFANAIRIVHDHLAGLRELRPEEVAAGSFPNEPLTIVPLALGLATVLQSAEEAILLATNIGGDSDSVASIAGGILGAMYPDTVNQVWYEVTERINGHNLIGIANELAVLRH